MSCFSDSFDPSTSSPLTVDATDQHVSYHGGWTIKEDSGKNYRVSTAKGDTATFYWTGTSVQVIGQIDSNGMNALFGIDQDGSNHGGASCKISSGSESQDVLLYDSASSSTPPSAQHTLFITNKGHPLSLNIFKVFDASVPASVIGPPLAPSTTSAKTQPDSTPASSTDGASSSISNGASSQTVTNSNPGPTLLPLPNPSAHPPGPTQSSISQISVYSAITDEGRSYARGAPTYTVSSHTEIITTGGSTIITVIQTTVEVPQTQLYRGPSRGAVAGASVGGLLLLFLLVGLGLWWWRRRRNRVRFLYGISNLDFDPAMMMRSDVEFPTPSLGAGVRDSDGTLYGGDTLPPYKRPASYLSFASDLKKHAPSERAVSAVAGDRRPSTDDERNTGSLPEEPSLRDSFSTPGWGSMGSLVLPSEERHEAL